MIVTIETESNRNHFALNNRQTSQLLAYAKKLAEGVGDRNESAGNAPSNRAAKKSSPYMLKMSEQPRRELLEDMEARRRRREEHIANGNENGWKGFLACECGKCGRIKTFMPHQPIKEYICKCGERTPLRDLIGAYATCSCGAEWFYKTNVRDGAFGIICMNCGRPIAMVRNTAGTGYNSVPDDEWQR